MKHLLLIFSIMLSTIGVSAQQTVYDFSVKNAKGETVSLSDYKGKVLLIVNTATRCGFTPQYEELESLYELYGPQGLEILDFPCNQFGQQAPGTIEEIQEFCSLNYGTKFPQFDKVDVNGPYALPLFTFLKSKQGFKGFDSQHPLGKVLHEMMMKMDAEYYKSDDIKWNFTKFLIDPSGNVVQRYEPTADISKIGADVKQLLDKLK